MATLPVPAIPAPDDTPQGLYQTVNALKLGVEALSGNVPSTTRAPKSAAAIAIGAAITKVIRLS
jgi:hypothetical protein